MAKKKDDSSGKSAREKSKAKGSASSKDAKPRTDGLRETIDSVVIAFILAFLFRTFEAEAFVIPTGSMATTLMGQHKDFECEKCGYRYRVSASVEEGDLALSLRQAINDPNTSQKQRERLVDQLNHLMVHTGVCPNCHFEMNLRDANGKVTQYPSYRGDRILVTKFPYQFAEPERFDIIVFRYPEAASINYIKRLVGLPGESVQIRYGDIYVKPLKGPGEYRITRKKKPAKLRAILFTVHDNDKLPRVGRFDNEKSPSILDRGWPARWQPAPAGFSDFVHQKPAGENWLPIKQDKQSWLPAEFVEVEMREARRQRPFDDKLRLTAEERSSILKSNALLWPDSFTAPGGWVAKDQFRSFQTDGSAAEEVWFRYRHFVAHKEQWDALQLGPLTTRPSETLIRSVMAYNEDGNRHHEPLDFPWVGDLGLRCELTVEKGGGGEAILELVEGGHFFQCRIDIATGKASLRIDGKAAGFDPGEDGKGTAPTANTAIQPGDAYRLLFTNVDDQLRLWVDGTHVEFSSPTTYSNLVTTRATPADYSPLAIGSNGAKLAVNHLEVLRDIYYDPERPHFSPEYPLEKGADSDQDQFFVLGDNSARSKDGRAWDTQHYVTRDLLIGKAMYIYWPHSWNEPVPLWPNWRRMSFVR